MKIMTTLLAVAALAALLLGGGMLEAERIHDVYHAADVTKGEQHGF